MVAETTLLVIALALLAALLWSVATLQRIAHRLITQNIELQRFKAAGSEQPGTRMAALRAVETEQHQLEQNREPEPPPFAH